jgi:predicted RND superfamily exporter protein
MRYRVEQGRTADRQAALDRTFAFAGRAILMTTVVLVVGFLPCLLSDYFSLWILGGLLPLVLVLAVLADLLLVPAMVQLGWLAVAPRSTGAVEPP